MPASDPIATFTRQHPVTGQKQERAAYSADERVQLKADGWLEKPAKSSSGSTSSSTATGSRSSSSSS